MGPRLDRIPGRRFIVYISSNSPQIEKLQILQRRMSRILRSQGLQISRTCPLVPTTVSLLLHHCFTPKVSRQLHHCKGEFSAAGGCNSPRPSQLFDRSYHRFTIASRDIFKSQFHSRSSRFTIVDAVSQLLRLFIEKCIL